MRLLIDLIRSLFNWFRPQSPPTMNRVWYFMDNCFVRCYLSGTNHTDNRRNKSWHGLCLYIITKNHPDCTGGFKAICSHRIWIVRSRRGNFFSPIWRKWDELATYLECRFHYIS
jgi:hypothetical protein